VNGEDNIDHSLKVEFWERGQVGTTYKKRTVGNKALGKHKTRKESINMIDEEKRKYLNPPVSTSHTTLNVNYFLADIILDMQDAYDRRMDCD
jgi:hypothetical protein